VPGVSSADRRGGSPLRLEREDQLARAA